MLKQDEIINIAKIFLKKKNFSILIIFFSLTILLIGFSTDLKFSDEIFHFWFAMDWHLTGKRPIYNELVDTIKEYNYYRYYVNAPLWHYILKSIFDLTGIFSKKIAQIYMTIWYVLLIFGTYLLAKKIFNEESGLYSAFIIGTMPFIVSFSILFFIDLPIAAVTPYLIYYLIKRKYLIGGIIMGFMFLLKENSYLLLPAACLLLLVNTHKGYSISLSKKFLQMMFFLLLIIIINLYNFKFKLDNFHGILIPHDHGAIFATIIKSFKTSYLSIHDMLKPEVGKPEVGKPEVRKYLTSSITSLPIFFKYFGVVFPLLLLWRVISILKYKDFHFMEIFLIIPIKIYLLLYFIAFQGWWEIRYLSPIIPLLVIFSVGKINYLKQRINVILIILGFIMFLSTITFTYLERRITIPEKEIIELIKQLPYGRILTPEELFISFNTGKPTVWYNSFTYTPHMGLYELFWDDSNSKKEKILKEFKIRYILIPKKRIYDDKKIRHFGGYPKSFLEKIKNISFIEKIYSNEYASIWRVIF